MSQLLPPDQLERIAKLAARTYAGPNKPLRAMLTTGWQSDELAWAAVVAVVVAEALPFVAPSPQPAGAVYGDTRGTFAEGRPSPAPAVEEALRGEPLRWSEWLRQRGLHAYVDSFTCPEEFDDAVQQIAQTLETLRALLTQASGGAPEGGTTE